MFSDQLFIFFAGIAVTTGIAYVWLGIIERNYRSTLFFGLFAIASGIYFILSSIQLESFKLALFFAVGMFVLFPWYFGYESKYINKPVLWTIVGLGIAYYISTFFNIRYHWFRLQYIFSYTAYFLTVLFCIKGLKGLSKTKNIVRRPLTFVTIYYTLFVTEEIAFNYFGNTLPWRRLFSLTYLDLFPIIIIGTQLIILVSDRLEKVKLAQSISFYKNNLKAILNHKNTLVASIDLDGKILYSNSFFKSSLFTNERALTSTFCELLSSDTLPEFKDVVFNEDNDKGNVISKFKFKNEDISIAWSFVKVKASETSKQYDFIYLFGHNITTLVESENNLRMAYKELELLKNKIQEENIQLKNESTFLNDSNQLIGESPNFNYVMNRIEDVAPLDVPVLLEGETGVGKELFANEIHKKSKRSDKPFIKINCSAIPKDLIESELFGYEKGAFTGADKLKRGMFELADTGTLFLDEFGELPLALQPKLLRVLQEGEIQRLGAEKIIKIDTRIIAATNLNLTALVEKGQFRSDLYYRINVFPVTIPPLRNRKADIPLLIDAFINLFNRKYTRQVKQISQTLMDDLTNHSWPGNIRQLKNIIERAIITSDGSKLKLAEALPKHKDHVANSSSNENATLETLADCERKHIIHVLEHCNWQIAGKNGAAQILNLPASTLRSKMKKLEIMKQS
ncbi:sigma 54-interacting transcriptional regulator [uncultured Algibacter sp.]|uniref:sigma-54 interaction domain-containing protein n=1 Tax=uncultured Algibacter sp. TaxID=298659 RepID=UPI0026312987|nr:sigma 54-interacting transcriptional regulator [uncultured Algibacter sp.]